MKLSKNVTRLTSTKGFAAYLILSSEGYILIDTGLFTAGRALLHELASLQIPTITKILLTHHDVDHIGNMSMLQRKFNCPVYINSLDLPYIQKKIRRKSRKAVYDFFITTDTSATLSPLESAVFKDLAVIHTPGHTPGHSSFLFEDFLFIGDFFRFPKLRLLPYKMRRNWLTEEMKNYLRSRVDLPFSWVCPAHYMPEKV